MGWVEKIHDNFGWDYGFACHVQECVGHIYILGGYVLWWWCTEARAALVLLVSAVSGLVLSA